MGTNDAAPEDTGYAVADARWQGSQSAGARDHNGSTWPKAAPLMGTPDNSVMADDVGFAAGDFDAFVIERGKALWRQAWLLTRDSQLAEDLVQTAFAKTWRRFEQLGTGYEPYVRRTIYTTYVSWWHRRWRGEVPTEQIDTLASVGPDQAVAQRHDLARQLACLSRMQRAVVVLRYVEDLSEAETATTLNISVGSVKTHASRGLKALRAALPNPGDLR